MLLTSEFPPSNLGLQEFQSVWMQKFEDSDVVRILVGFISAESLNFLDQLTDIHPNKKIELVVGMAKFDGLTQGQLTLLLNIDKKLRTRKQGNIYFAEQFPFHGKMHLFGDKEKFKFGIVGSSNLSNIVPQTGLTRGSFEVDFLISDSNQLKSLVELSSSLISEASSPIEMIWETVPIQARPSMALQNHRGAVKISSSELAEVKKHITSIFFKLPLKTEAKSSLNVYFGEGRRNGSQVRPRNWYESALIVNKNVMDSIPGYPKHKSFIVYTDDGYRFAMRTGGGNSKNLESLKDLTTFGRWIKGKLEDANVLQTGERVTDQTLLEYGNSYLTLTKTDRMELHQELNEMLEVWTLDFVRPSKL